MTFIEKTHFVNHNVVDLEVGNQGNEYQMKKFLNAYTSLSHTNDRAIDDFYYLLCEDFTSQYRQEDSHKLFTYLLEILNKYISRKNGKPESKVFKYGGIPTEKKDEDTRKPRFLSNGYGEVYSSGNNRNRGCSQMPVAAHKPIKQKIILKTPFTGKYYNWMKWMGCEEESGRIDEPSDCLSIACTYSSVEKNLSAYFTGEVLSNYPCFKWSLLSTLKSWIKERHKNRLSKNDRNAGKNFFIFVDVLWVKSKRKEIWKFIKEIVLIFSLR